MKINHNAILPRLDANKGKYKIATNARINYSWFVAIYLTIRFISYFRHVILFSFVHSWLIFFDYRGFTKIKTTKNYSTTPRFIISSWSARFSTSTWTPSSVRLKNCTIPACAASPSRWAAARKSAAWWPPAPILRTSAGCTPPCP